MVFLPFVFLWLRRTTRWNPSLRYSVALLAVVLMLAVASRGLSTDTSSSSGEPAGKRPSQHREGTRIVGLVATFSESARRWTCTSAAGDVTFRVLENQTLFRITRAITSDPRDNQWKVSGVLTEFGEENYLLLNRAERTSTPSS